ncbi:MAG: serine hydroxymethyltransferase, partial [Bacteroidales bacterium]
SGIRVGTPAITTRGVKEDMIPLMVELINEVIVNIDNQLVIQKVKEKVNAMMHDLPIFAY